jgi:dihydrofolate reductase
MTNTLLDMAMSLDGYIAGVNEEDGSLHKWYFDPAPQSRAVIEESISTFGALIMGRRSYEMGAAFDGFVDNPYKIPHLIITHTIADQKAKGAQDFIFVTDGIESAFQQARAAAGDKTVAIAGGASIARQFLQAGLVDRIQLHLVPILLGGGIRLFDTLDNNVELEVTRVITAPAVTHLMYNVVRQGAPQ